MNTKSMIVSIGDDKEQLISDIQRVTNFTAKELNQSLGQIWWSSLQRTEWSLFFNGLYVDNTN